MILHAGTSTIIRDEGGGKKAFTFNYREVQLGENLDRTHPSTSATQSRPPNNPEDDQLTIRRSCVRCRCHRALVHGR